MLIENQIEAGENEIVSLCVRKSNLFKHSKFDTEVIKKLPLLVWSECHFQRRGEKKVKL